MITCKLGDKEYFVDFVNGRTLREIQPALEAYGALNATVEAAGKGEPIPNTQMTLEEALDRMVVWFCGLFRNQFTPDMVYDLYPADRMVCDLMLAIMAVNTARTAALEAFPTKAAAVETKP